MPSPNATRSSASVFVQVQRCIVEALEVSPEEVTPKARLIRDLGAESVDLLDIVFRLERAFRIRIPRGAIEKNAKARVKRWREGSTLSKEALAVLRESLPEVDPADIKPGLKPKDIPTLFSVQTFVGLVERALEGQPAGPRAAGNGKALGASGASRSAGARATEARRGRAMRDA